MIQNLLTILTISLYDFLVASIESVLVFFILNIVYKNYRLKKHAMTDAVSEFEDVEDSADTLLPLPEFADLSNALLLTDGDKTKRIEELEAEVASLNVQLTEARNLSNTLYSEVDRYKRVNGQVGWLIEQFRRTISGSDISKLRQSTPRPLQFTSLSIMGVETEGSQATEKQNFPEPTTEEIEAEDEYSEDWETSEETEDQNADILFEREATDQDTSDNKIIVPETSVNIFIGPVNIKNTESLALSHSAKDQPPSKGPRDPTPVPSPQQDPEAELDALLAVATPQTHISEIFRRWYGPPSGPPPTPTPGPPTS